MRRTDREITDFKEMLSIVDACDVVRIGLCDGPLPYIVPLNFGYECSDGRLIFYFHGAFEGRKMSLIKANGGFASFEMDTDHELLSGEAACSYTYRYHSVMGEGRIELLSDPDEKKEGLRVILKHYTDIEELPMNEQIVSRTCIMKMTIEKWSCKGC